MNTKRLIISILPIPLLLGIYFIFNTSNPPSSQIIIPNAEKHRGVCWVGGPREIDESEIINLANHNINWISQTPFGWQSGHDNPEIGTLIGQKGFRGMWGERDEGLKKTTELAKKHGIKTILKPHIWLRDEAGKWRGEIQMKSEEDWLKWFQAYETFILHYAKLAEESQMEMLCIGTELHQTCVEREKDWRSLIAKVRSVYSGKLTYAANFSKEYEEVQFWDALDYIGVQAYFPLASEEEASEQELRKGWQQPIKDLEKISAKFDKPILFTEVGYKSTKNAGVTPWEWPARINESERETIFSEQAQANCFKALFDEVLELPWMAGVHIWKWYPNYENQRFRGNNQFNIDFTPQNKLAEKIISEEFAKLK